MLPKLQPTNTLKLAIILALIAIGIYFSIPNAYAEEVRGNCIDWQKFNLSNDQNQQIQALEQDWNSKYMQLQPQIVDLQHKLVRLLSDPKSDPVEIMTCQQAIARLKEQLRNLATANYLHKRAVLTNNQQHQLEFMLQQAIAERQKSTMPSVQTDESGLGSIIHKVKWAIQQH